MARPKKLRQITSAEVLEFIEHASQEILEVMAQLIEKKLVQLKEIN